MAVTMKVDVHVNLYNTQSQKAGFLLLLCKGVNQGKTFSSLCDNSTFCDKTAAKQCSNKF